ncbi:MAG: methionine adenosyltransferase [Christensenellales bacterium]|jgi:S-adenosylmethionine synthetase|nr:methionine adenosyltransferase [Clostridiales bacterium]
MKKLFTAESVTAGHPDKMCDQISDAVLDAILTEDKDARVACETCATTGLILVMGEITTSTYVPIQDIARGVALDLGYNRAKFGFDGHTCAVLTAVNEQSPDIAGGVNNALESRDGGSQITGAGDQGMMFGYASNETEELLPMPIALAHRLARRMDEVRRSKQFPWMRPDGKSQVSMVYENGKPVAISNIVISTQHDEKVSQTAIREAMTEAVIRQVIPAHLFTDETELLVNPSGRFVLGGPAGDSGLTGRKIIVDTYGGFVPHGGGCFSGKDPTKVDRSGAYMARYAAVNVVAAGLANRCQVALAYAIGRAQPVSFTVDTFGTGKVRDDVIEKALQEVMDFTPDGIISTLDLRRPIYRQTAAYGHFGRLDLDLPWEKANQAEALKKAVR